MRKAARTPGRTIRALIRTPYSLLDQAFYSSLSQIGGMEASLWDGRDGKQAADVDLVVTALPPYPAAQWLESLRRQFPQADMWVLIGNGQPLPQGDGLAPSSFPAPKGAAGTKERASPPPGPSPNGGLPPSLTGREGEVLRLVMRGLSNRGIASSLVVSPDTVKTHLRRLMAKLGASNRTELAMKASLPPSFLGHGDKGEG